MIKVARNILINGRGNEDNRKGEENKEDRTK